MSAAEMTRREAHNAQQIEYWHSKVAEYGDKLSHAKKKLREAQEAASPFQVGDVVEARMWGARQEFQPAIVRKIRVGYDGWRVSLRKKNGEWSKSERSAAEVRASLSPSQVADG